MRLYPDATNQYLADPTSGLNTKASRTGYRQALRALQLRNPELHVADFTEDHLIEYIGRPGLSPATVAGYRTRFQGFFSWAVWKNLRQDNPALNLKRLVSGSYTKPVVQHHWLTTAEVSRVLESADTSTLMGLRNLVVLRLGFTMGLRRTEIAELKWDQVDLTRQSLSLLGKGGKRASLYITDATLPWLDKWHSMGPGTGPVVCRFNTKTDFQTGWRTEPDWDRGIQGEAIGDIAHKAATENGIQFAAHDMRRSFANMLEEKGASIEEISAALRHSNLGTTQRYLERRQDAAFNAVRKRGLDV
jgi:site-specific recombinase XerD